MSIHIITSFYVPTNDSVREKELKDALNYNINNPLIKQIHLYLDKQPDVDYISSLSTDKIKTIQIGKQPLYSDLFAYANTIEIDKNDICMICNSDIWLYNTQIDDYIMDVLNDNIIFSLTRYEMDGTCPFIINGIHSHDAYLFKTPLHPLLSQNMNHKQNLWGSEHRVNDILRAFKYTVINPSIQIKIIHEHDMKRPNRIESNRKSVNHSNHFIPPTVIRPGSRIFQPIKTKKDIRFSMF
jgi:hypothetical protein